MINAENVSKLYLSGIEIENGIKSPISKLAPNCTLVELKFDVANFIFSKLNLQIVP